MAPKGEIYPFEKLPKEEKPYVYIPPVGPGSKSVPRIAGQGDFRSLHPDLIPEVRNPKKTQ